MIADRPGVGLTHEARPEDGGSESRCWRFWHFEFLYSYNKSLEAVGAATRSEVVY